MEALPTSYAHVWDTTGANLDIIATDMVMAEVMVMDMEEDTGMVKDMATDEDMAMEGIVIVMETGAMEDTEANLENTTKTFMNMKLFIYLVEFVCNQF